MKSRVEQATATFEEGYTCAQSVFSTYADLFGMDKETALKLSSPMGGGIGRMREVCGAVSAMALLAGLKEGNTDPTNEEGKEKIYLLTRQMAEKFREQFGTIVCRELLGIEGMEESAKPSVRTQQYYQERPCLQLIAAAAKIIEEMLLADKY
ncbi:MAG: C-GCAxxG-C-C family protein [Lachnospiraceae bacterium]|nr:C-GCAxxG-C-C family protein [Lachnospiraceae bacterium]